MSIGDLEAPPPTFGIFGGSFDPPHVGHVLLVAYALTLSEVDRVLVIPAWQHPLDKDARAPYEDRFRMCELAFSRQRGVDVSPIERELGGASRTLRTVEELARRHPGSALRLLLGADLLPETPRWHRWDRIVDLSPPLVVGRAGYPAPAGSAVQLPDVSSTQIRRRLAAGQRTAGLVPHDVEDHIFERGLYSEVRR